MLKHFLANDGPRAFLNECDMNFTYLSVYRKNHLKQILNLSAGKSGDEKPLLSYEEALQTKAKYNN